jgi:hypothetical protein
VSVAVLLTSAVTGVPNDLGYRQWPTIGIKIVFAPPWYFGLGLLSLRSKAAAPPFPDYVDYAAALII